MADPGVVFTKAWVVDFVLDTAGYTSDRSLWKGCVVEPACGAGAFLQAIVRRLCISARREGVLSYAGLADCVRAFDLDQSAVAMSRNVARDALICEGLQSQEASALARRWVQHADFLLSELPPVTWVVGNPPYVKSSLIPRAKRESYRKLLSCVTMGSDLYVGFIQKGLSILEDDGVLCYICADRWLQNRYGAHLRSFVSEGYSLLAHIRMHGVDAFEEEVSAYPGISLLCKGAGKPFRFVDCQSDFSREDVAAVGQWIRSAGDPCGLAHAQAAILNPLVGSDSVPLASPQTLSLIDCISERYPALEDAGIELGIGVATGCDKVYVTEDPDLVERDRLLPLFYMRDWRSGKRGVAKFLVSPWSEDGSLVDLSDYPRLGEYFRQNERRLKARRVAHDHPDAWYRTLDKPDHSLLGREMLLFPDMSARPDPVYCDGSRYPHHNCYWMTSREWDIRSLGGLMMSDIAEAYVDAYGVKMRGSTLRFQAQYLRRMHIPKASDVDDNTKRELAEAFAAGDRARANASSRKAYGLEGIDA